MRRQRERFSNNGGRERTIVVGGICTFLGALFIVWMGTELARLFFFLVQPDCVMTNDGLLSVPLTAAGPETKTKATNNVDGLKKSKSSASNDGEVRTRTSRGKSKSDPIPVGTTSSTGSSSSIKKASFFPFPDTAKFPPQCTKDQYLVLQKQLPPDGCKKFEFKPWIFQSCSFASSTVCGNSSPRWLYDYIQEEPVKIDNDNNNNDDNTFRAILVGCNKGYDAIELLRIASPPSDDGTKKYDWMEWESKFLHIDSSIKVDERVACPISGTAPSNTKGTFKKSQVFCIEGYPKTYDHLVKTKNALGYSDDELDLTNSIAVSMIEKENDGKIIVFPDDPVGVTGVGVTSWAKRCRKNPEACTNVESTTIDNWLKTKPSLITNNNGNKPTIHYMSITVEGSDYDILRGAAQNLGRIQYIDFRYHWNYRWGDKSLKDLIFRLKKKGFVCYWTGSNGKKLWRITDCWQEHYEIKYVASMGCVNSNIPAAESLLNRMESIFLETLRQN